MGAAKPIAAPYAVHDAALLRVAGCTERRGVGNPPRSLSGGTAYPQRATARWVQAGAMRRRTKQTTEHVELFVQLQRKPTVDI